MTHDPPPAPPADAARPPSTPSTPVGARVFRLVLGVVVAAAALKLARPVLVPLVAGVFLAVLARPLERRVAGALPRRLRWVGLVVALLAVLGGLAGFGGALYVSVRAVATELRERRPRLEASLAGVRARLARSGVPAGAMPQGRSAAGRPRRARTVRRRRR
jgi:predicted PurR-regulated permease PerM